MPSQRPPAYPPDAGLCRACQHSRLVLSARGSVFVLCTAPLEYQLNKYPRLPVLDCPAFAPNRPAPSDDVE